MIDVPANKRNFGFWNEAEQAALSHSTVAVAGAGGDGYQLSLKLAMMGVGRLKVADPEDFEPENSNRVLGATVSGCGRNKAEVLREHIAGLPRDVKVDVYTDGVTEDNIEDFMQGADLIIDESELRYPRIGAMIARQALKLEIPQLEVMNIGFAGVATSYHPSGKNGFHEAMGIPIDASLDEVAEMEIDYSRLIPYIPGYGDYETLRAVIDGAPLPSISQGVDIASGIGSTEAFLHLTSRAGNKRRSPTWSPRYRYYDAYTNKSGTIRYPVASYYVGALSAYIRTRSGLNPRASYRHEA